MNKTVEELQKLYEKEVEIDTEIDATNVLAKQMSLPGIRHKWIYRLIQAKKGLLELMDQKEKIINSAIAKDSIGVTSQTAKRRNAENSSSVVEINKSIKDMELLVEYLDYVVNKVFAQVVWEIKNLVDLMKMETL